MRHREKNTHTIIIIIIIIIITTNNYDNKNDEISRYVDLN